MYALEWSAVAIMHLKFTETGFHACYQKISSQSTITTCKMH